MGDPKRYVIIFKHIPNNDINNNISNNNDSDNNISNNNNMMMMMMITMIDNDDNDDKHTHQIPRSVDMITIPMIVINTTTIYFR